MEKLIALNEIPGLPGVWKNTEYTFLSFDKLEDLPLDIQAPIRTWIGKWICSVDPKLPKPTLIQDETGKPFFVYQLKNNILQHATYEALLIDAALTTPGAEMSFGGDDSALLVKHAEGFYLIANINLSIKKEVDFY